MKRISDIIGEIFLAVFVGIIFLSFACLVYFAIVFVSGFIFGPKLIRDSGLTGQIIVGVITLIIVILPLFPKFDKENFKKLKKYIYVTLSIILVFLIGWYFYIKQIPSFNEGAYTDQNGSDFRVVTIGEQTWMAENLNVLTFRNGDTIYHAKTSKDWVYANENKIPAWCYYNNDTLQYKKQGKLYNWYAIIDVRGIAPQGWRIPFQKDWETLSESLGGDKKSGIKLKDTSWNSSEEKRWGFFSEYKFIATDTVKLSLLPCGAINLDGYFYGMKKDIYPAKFSGWWHINEDNTDYAYIVYLTNGTENLFFNNVNQGEGFYVRCIKD